MLFLTGPVTPHVRDLVRLENPSCSASFRPVVQVLLLAANETGSLSSRVTERVPLPSRRLRIDLVCQRAPPLLSRARCRQDWSLV